MATSLLARPAVRCTMYLAGGYLGLLLMLLFFENRLIYHPSTQSVPAPPNSTIQDVDLISADTRSLLIRRCTSDTARCGLASSL